MHANTHAPIHTHADKNHDIIYGSCLGGHLGGTITHGSVTTIEIWTMERNWRNTRGVNDTGPVTLQSVCICVFLCVFVSLYLCVFVCV